jgi:hypothetical protein
MKNLLILATILLTFGVANTQKVYGVNNEAYAKKKIYFVNHEVFADLMIYFVNNEAFAGLKKRSKINLMQ